MQLTTADNAATHLLTHLHNINKKYV